jgi:hypothetical protein
VIDVLTGSAIDLKEPGWDEETGFGVVNFNKAVQVAKETAPQLYIPALFSNPTTWGLEGQVTPLERATADQFNGKSYDWESYTLKFGDTLSQIALDRTGNASSDAYNWIAQKNNIPDASKIKAGATIQIPKEVAAPVDNPVVQPPVDNPVVQPPVDNPVVQPPVDNPVVQPPTSINLNGYTVGGNFYPVFQNYQGTLGNPTSDVTNYNGMSYQIFEKGSIVSSKNGTFPLYGAIRQEFLNTGGLNGRLGAPTSEEKNLGGNIVQYFEHGNIYWNGSKPVAYKTNDKAPTVQIPSNIPSKFSDLKIDLFDPYGQFTSSEWATIRQAADNWENIITKDMIPSGNYKIAITKRKLTGNESGWFAGTYEGQKPDRNINEPSVDINGVDYHNLIEFNTLRFSALFSNNLFMRVAMHEIGNTLGLKDSNDPNSLMNHSNIAPNMTEEIYQGLENLGYGVDRNVPVDL